MSEEETANQNTAFSYIWYTAIWYLIQFLLITVLHFLSTKKLDKKVVQNAASDTLLLALVFLCLQWSQRFLSCAIYRLPYVAIHLFMDLIPTALWLAGSVLLLLSCLGLAQKLYHHLTDSKEKTSSIESHLNMKYFVSVSKSQDKLEETLRKHISSRFPKLTQRLEEKVDGSPALIVLFTSATLLLQLSSLGLAFIDASWIVLKTGYHRVTHKRMQDMKDIFHQLMALTVTTLAAACFIQYKTVTKIVSAAKRAIRQISSSHFDSKKKSMKANNGTSADDAIAASGEYETEGDCKQHDD